MSRHLRVNDILQGPDGSIVILLIRPQSDLVRVHNDSLNAEESMSLLALTRAIARGEYNLNGPKPLQGRFVAASANSAAYSQMLYRDAVIKAITDKVKAGSSPSRAIDALLGTEIAVKDGTRKSMCSKREAYRLLDEAKNQRSLVPNYSCRGNRKPRYGTRMIEIVMEVVHSAYATTKGRIGVSAVRDIAEAVARQERVLDPAQTISKKFVISAMKRNWSADLDEKRLDPRAAKALKAVAANRIRPGGALQRVEIDTLHVPMVLKRSYGEVAEDVWLVLAIDCETSCLLGWLLIFAAPTAEDVITCIERAIYPKDDILRRMGIDIDIDPFGTPMNAVMDNGPENSRVRLSRLTLVGINPEWVEANSGHQKPFIERFNRSIKDDFLDGLPGCTRFNGKDGARKQEALKDDLWTEQRFEREFLRFAFEKWVHKPLERFVTADYEIETGLGLTPYERWKTYANDYVLPLAPPPSRWHEVRFLKEERALNRKTGISWENFDFKGDKLPLLIKQYGSGTSVDFFYNPSDYRLIYVPHKVTGEWVRLVNAEVTDDTPAYSFAEAKKRRKLLKQSVVRHPASDRYDADRAFMRYEQTAINSDPPGPNKYEQKRATNQKVRTQQAKERARTNPIRPESEAGPQKGSSFVVEDEVPQFDTLSKSGHTQ